MSHVEYCENLDEDQLLSLIEVAKSRAKKIREEGWVDVWCVCSDEWIVRGRYKIDEYAEAVDRLNWVVKSEGEKGGSIEAILTKERVRPSDLDELLSTKYA